MMQNIKYAYKQAPWRKQIRGVVWVLSALVMLVMVAIAYLNISAQTYEAGVNIQVLRGEQETLIHKIADLRDQLGSVTSFETMAQKASASGYSTINDPARIVYLPVPGYVEPGIHIDVPRQDDIQSQPILKPAYSQSLWDLFMDGALKLGKDS
jgi:hypothetical protein